MWDIRTQRATNMAGDGDGGIMPHCTVSINCEYIIREAIICVTCGIFRNIMFVLFHTYLNLLKSVNLCHQTLTTF